ncbi:MAG: 50S ribosomal protein L11 methyltransferase [Negativicutes bacterium]|nr:50S ribosomal protein L11 methyltransferase [Negativicutes bacterium]
MKWAEISIQTSHEATEPVANIFHDLGASGVVIEDPELVNSYRRSGNWEYCDIPEEEDTDVVTVKAYLPVDADLDAKLALFEKRISELINHDIDKGRGLIRWREVQEEDWASAWKEHFQPVKIGERVVIKPTWCEYTAGEGDVVIELDPGMAFGTGTHHTTVMCLRMLEDVVRPGATVFDIGTGSGILAVAAAKLGAGAVRAVDLDAVAVRVANENITVNKVGDIVTAAQGDLLTGLVGQADILVANIIADVIIQLVSEVPARLTDGGWFIAGGIIAERVGDVTKALLASGLVLERVAEEGGWVTMLACRGGA